MSVATLTKKNDSPITDLKSVKAMAGSLITDFEEDALRDVLFSAAGEQLKQVANSSEATINEQMGVIREAVTDFEAVREGMSAVQSNVSDIDHSVATVVDKASDTSKVLEKVSERMQALEENVKAISGLVRSVNRIADQTNLLALNATIEAARAGEAGKGFSVVAHEVKELASTTKTANDEIGETLDQISDSVNSLSSSVEQSVLAMQESAQAVEAALESASTIEVETSRFGQRIQRSYDNFRKLDESSCQVSNEMKELRTIGDTFSYLTELMSAHQSLQLINPLERLLPLVERSTFRDEKRFSQKEPEYLLTDEDILISATDTRGMITFANNCFYRIAEYDAGELFGTPHNVIRHPDMPKTAFADLWGTIAAGKLWQGYVLNRSKHGRGYWVKASVFPCYENGSIVGYISIRTKPEKEMVEKAKQAYRLVP